MANDKPNQFDVDAQGLAGHCGLAATGIGSGVCKDADCGRRVPTLIGDYCIDCAPKHGLSPLNLGGDCCSGDSCRARGENK